MDQLTNALFLFQEQMRAQFEQLSSQIANINQPHQQPPPHMHGGSTYYMSDSETLPTSEHTIPYTEMPQTPTPPLNASQHYPITNPYQQCTHHHQTRQQLTQWL